MTVYTYASGMNSPLAPACAASESSPPYVDGSAQFHVLDDGGRTVGAVYEDRQWADDDNYGAVRYLVVHNPRLTVSGTSWRSEGPRPRRSPSRPKTSPASSTRGSSSWTGGSCHDS